MWQRQERRSELASDFWALADARPGWRVADVGCGPGYFAIRYAAMTGPTGHVHAVDVSPEALEYLRSRLDPIHHAHLTTEVLDIERVSLPDLHFDALFCTDVLHHARDLRAALRHLREARAPLVIAEFDPRGPGDIGPPIEDRLSPDALVQALRGTGWTPKPWVALRHEHFAIVAR